MYTPIDLQDKFEFKIGERVLRIRHIPAHRQLYLLSAVQFHYKELKKLTEMNAPENSYFGHYYLCVNAVWELIKNSSSLWNRWRVRREFFKKANSDCMFFIELSNYIFDFWLSVGKLIALLAGGQSLQMAHGQVSVESFLAKGSQNQKSENYLLKILTAELADGVRSKN